MQTSVKMTMTNTEAQIQQLEMCIESTQIMAKLESDLDVKAMCRIKIRDFRNQIKALQSA